MAMEVEEAFPSFSTERIRSKMQVRDGPIPQRRLDYNAPLLSVRRLADLGGDTGRKVWKLSGELSKEPLRVPGAVPFTWEHSPGRPKQPESPPRVPSSPSPPSTPSPPSSRRASPASPSLPPAPPPLRPLFLRSNSSMLFAPPPPPPPPPPPLPRIHPLPVLTRRSAPRVECHLSTSLSPRPPPPPPPPYPPTISHVPKQAAPALQNLPDHERMGAFRLVDPSEGFLRLLRARREKAEPEEFLAAHATENAAEASREPSVVLEVVGTSKVQHHDLINEGREEVAAINDNSNCVVVDAIVQRFLDDHPDDDAKDAASAEGQDDGAKPQDDQAGLDTGESIDLSCVASNDDATQGEDVIAGTIDPCSIFPLKEDAGYTAVLQEVCSDHEGLVQGEPTLEDCASTPTWENSKLENGAPTSSVCTTALPSFDALEVPLEEGHTQSLVKKQRSKRRTSSIAILDSCRVESLRMIKSALVQLCRKAAAASRRTLGKARRKVALSQCTSSSLDLVVHCNSSKGLDKGGSDHEEEAVVREVKAILQERLFEETEQRQSLASTPCGPPISLPKSPMPHSPLMSPSKSSSPRLSPCKSSVPNSPQLSPRKSSMPHSPRMSPRKSSMPHSPRMSPQKSSMLHSPRMSPQKSSMPQSPPISPHRSSRHHSPPISPHRSSTPHSPRMSLAKSSTPHSPCSPPPKSSTSMQECTESRSISPPKPSIGFETSMENTCPDTNNAVKTHVLLSPSHLSLHPHNSPDSHLATQGETQGIQSTTSSARHMYTKSLGGDERNAFSARHLYAKSLGGDEPNEFYDASSRFGSQSSTPSRINSMNRSMSKEWGASDDFLDATSTPFETPRTSVSDNRYAMSDTESLPYASATTSKLVASKRATSKLSKRVGKALWVDTKEMKGAGKVDAIRSNGFLSGELYISSNEKDLVLNKKEMNASRRKYVSGDQQQASSSSTSLRQNKRGIPRSTDGKVSSSSTGIAVTPVFPSKCQKNRSMASASGLPRQISTGNMADMGWPLGISGYPPLKTCTKGKEERRREEKKQSVKNIMPSPPLPPSPAGGSWLRKALSSNTISHAPSRLAGLHAMASSLSKKVEPSHSPSNKWEDIVKGSHVQPGHLRFSEELHHNPPSNLNSNKYYLS